MGISIEMRKILFVMSFALAVPCAGFVKATNLQSQASDGKPAQTSPDLAEATRLSARAVELYNQIRYDEALPLAKQALELREKALGPNHELIATSLNNIAGIYQAKEKYSDAEALYKRSLKVLEQRYGVESKYLTKTIEQLAWMRFALHNNGDAEKLFLRALAIKQSQYGPEQIETAQTLSSFGTFYERINKLDKAADYFRRSVVVREKILEPNNLGLLEALDDCACALLLDGKVDEGRKYQERAEKIRSAIAADPINRQGGFLQSKAILRVEPEYPVAARQLGVRGTVVVEVLVDECGKVLTATPKGGPTELRDAAVAAARRWRFTITRLGSRRVKVIGTITFNFHL